MVDKEKHYGEMKNGSIEVTNGTIIVEDPVGDGAYAKLMSNNKLKIYINAKQLIGTSIVKKSDKVIVVNESVKGKRSINISTNIDKTEAKITVKYEQGLKYKLRECIKSNIQVLECDEIEGELPPLFKGEEVINYLNEKGIVFGVNKEEISKVEKSRNIKDLSIAKSISMEQPVDDKIKYNGKKIEKNEESMKNIDYKNIISIESVKKDDIIAEIIKGSIGRDGISVYGKEIKRRPAKKLKFQIGDGCRLEGDKIIATIDGKVSISNNNFKVNKLHSVNGDVDIKTGNVNFVGDVNVNGKVTEGMSVIANSINVTGGVFKANIKLNDSSIILGNIFDSKIEICYQVVVNEKRMQSLIFLKEQLESLLMNIIYLKEKKLVNKGISDGYLIKTLIESKYKSMSKTCITLSELELSGLNEDSKVSEIIRSKLIGLGPINIKEYTELQEIIESINSEIELFESQRDRKSDLIIEYCQEANIEVAGNVYIVGKGSYTTKVFSTGNIEFTKDDAVCRGGYLTAKDLIKAKVVGSTFGVETKLQVEGKGHIYVDIAYQNTTFIVGKRKYILNKHARNVHVYNDENGEIMIDKLNL